MVAASLVMLGVVATSTPTAGAHVDLIGACPRGGEVMSFVDSIELGFEGPIFVEGDRPATITLIDAARDQVVAAGPATRLGPAAMGVELETPLGAGTYRLEYSVVSQDLDDNFGDFVFVVEPGSDVATDCADQTVESDSSVVPTVLTVVVPILVAGVAIAFLNRWARRRSDGAAAEADDSTD